jgi:hypothetical protein
VNQTFQNEINEGWVVIYMDDILIFSSSAEEHKERTRRILDKLRQERLFLKPTKCTFDVQEVDFLGMIIRPGQVAMDPAKLSGIKDWKSPTSLKEVWSFLGFCNFYWHFISHYSDIAQPLIDLTKKDHPFDWNEACEEAFLALKKCFLSEPVLQNPDPDWQFAIATDASLVASGGILLQTDGNGKYHPCGYLSQSFNPAERNYQIYDRELLTILHALKAWWHFLAGSHHPIIVFTDHDNLRHFRTPQHLTPRQSHWHLAMTEYDLQIYHVPGRKLVGPDALSWCGRCPIATRVFPHFATLTINAPIVLRHISVLLTTSPATPWLVYHPEVCPFVFALQTTIPLILLTSHSHSHALSTMSLTGDSQYLSP